MSSQSSIILTPTAIELGQIDYWIREFGVSKHRLLQAVSKVGLEIDSIRKYLNEPVTIAIRDDYGNVRRVTKIIPMTDGFSVSVPYHSAKEGWLYKHPVKYGCMEGRVKLSDFTHFSASDRVKLSMHLDGGFVQFSTGGKEPILSGRDKDTGDVKGLGLTAPSPIIVKSGPLFGVQINDLTQFELLGGRKAEVFIPDDFYMHPRLSRIGSTAYHIEGFMFPKHWANDARNDNGKLMLVKELPQFISMFRFPFYIRVIEFPHLKWMVGLIIHRMDKFGEGYSLNGPSVDNIAIGARYPKPEYVDTVENMSSLDYKPNKSEQ